MMLERTHDKRRAASATWQGTTNSPKRSVSLIEHQSYEPQAQQIHECPHAEGAVTWRASQALMKDRTVLYFLKGIETERLKVGRYSLFRHPLGVQSEERFWWRCLLAEPVCE